jgi:hypothetical protein
VRQVIEGDVFQAALIIARVGFIGDDLRGPAGKEKSEHALEGADVVDDLAIEGQGEKETGFGRFCRAEGEEAESALRFIPAANPCRTV